MFGLFKKNVIFYPGCLTKYKLNHIANNYLNILKKLGYKVTLLKEEETCCGGPLIESGYDRDFQETMERNKEIFRANNVDKIITSCPLCYDTFLRYYGIKTEHIVQILAKNAGRIPYKYNEEKVTYFDPCLLGRKNNVFGAEKILDALGMVVITLKGNNAVCCGACSGLKRNLPVLAEKMAKNILAQVKTEKLITACPLCYAHLKENAKKIKVLELSEVL